MKKTSRSPLFWFGACLFILGGGMFAAGAHICVFRVVFSGASEGVMTISDVSTQDAGPPHLN